MGCKVTDDLTCNDHSQTIIHVLDDLEGNINAGGFGVGFYTDIFYSYIVNHWLSSPLN
jgi:hypothetical protein